jgi:hypothetical protein
MTEMPFLYIPATGLSLHYAWLWFRNRRARRFMMETWGVSQL